MDFETELEELRARSLYRRLREINSPPGTVAQFPGRTAVNFASNDYLGLANHPVLREAAVRAIEQYGTGSGSSRLISGTLSPHLRLEEKIAEFKRTGAALSFSSGYAAATGALSALLMKEDVVILDKLSHASLIDGARLSGATIRVFPHNHMGKLESHLEWAREHHPDARILVVTESVFSMDGDRAALREMVEIKDRYQALLLVDEAHAIGVIGAHGRGLVDELRLTKRVDIQMGTLSKALGVSGGYIAGSRKLIELLINRARSFIYSTAPPPALAAASEAAIDFLSSQDGETLRQKLWTNLGYFAAQMGRTEEIQSAIVPLIIGSETDAIHRSRELFQHGYFVPAIRYPTVAKGAARLRLTFSATHTAEQIDGLAQTLLRLNRTEED